MKKVLKPFSPFPETFRIFDHISVLRDILQFDKTLGFLFGNLRKNQNVIFQTPQKYKSVIWRRDKYEID